MGVLGALARRPTTTGDTSLLHAPQTSIDTCAPEIKSLDIYVCKLCVSDLWRTCTYESSARVSDQWLRHVWTRMFGHA